MYKLFIKRFLDIFFSLIGLIILSPILILIAVVIFFQDFGSIIYIQERVGKDGLIFKFYKFRSMAMNTPNVPSSETSKLKVTPFGKVLRRTNLDELPQLINILKGDMSIVGPRPPIPSQENLIRLRETNGALKCRPGLTGLAQVNSYDYMPEEEKSNWDGTYARSISALTDLKILLKTILYLTKKPPVY